MALSNLFGWNTKKETAAAAACGTACGAGDKPEEKPAACGTACGAGDNQDFGRTGPSSVRKRSLVGVWSCQCISR